jgi:hypothetical protein
MQTSDLRVVFLAFIRGHRGLGNFAKSLGRPEQSRGPHPIPPGQRHESERLELVGDRPAIAGVLPPFDRLVILGLRTVEVTCASHCVRTLALGRKLEPTIADGVELDL